MKMRKLRNTSVWLIIGMIMVLFGFTSSAVAQFWQQQDGTTNIYYNSGNVDIGTDTLNARLNVRGNASIVATNKKRGFSVTSTLDQDGVAGQGDNDFMIGAEYESSLSGSASTTVTGLKAFANLRSTAPIVQSLKGAYYVISVGNANPTVGETTISEVVGFEYRLGRLYNNHRIYNITNSYGAKYNIDGIGNSGTSKVNITNHYHQFLDDPGMPYTDLTVTNMAGIWINKQTTGTNNYGIVLNGDGVGADLVLGAGKETKLYGNGGNFIIDTAGNVGIGTANPGAKLEISAGDWGGMQIKNSADPEVIGGLRWTPPTGYDDHRWLMLTNETPTTAGTGNDGGIMFRTNSGPTSGYTAPQMVITQFGNVGIGTRVPNAKLDVAGNIRGTELCIGIDCRTSWPVSQNSSSGNVGIGTTEPSSLLEIAGQNSDADLRLTRTTDVQRGSEMGKITFRALSGSEILNWAQLRVVVENATTGSQSAGLAFDTRNADGSMPERVRIAGNGNVGIGTANPGAMLQINSHDDSSSPALSIRQDNASTYGFDFKLDTLVDGKLYLDGINAGVASNVITFDRTSGNVGIGRTDPGEKLHVAGNIQVDGNINAKYQDLAEYVRTSESLTTGMVVMIDTKEVNQVIPSDKAYNTLVAGVVSETPGIILGEGGADKAIIAHTGRVKVKVDTNSGEISAGDLLVTSPVKGYAMKADADKLKPGMLLGKALEPLKEGQRGEILVLITLQ